MPHKIFVTIRANVSADKVWTTLKEFNNVYKFNIGVTHAELTSDATKPFGLGTSRICTLNDKSTIVEEVTAVNDEDRTFAIVMSEYSMPLNTFEATVQVKDCGADTCEMTVGMYFDAKFGRLGWLLAVMLIKPNMKGAVREMLTCLAYHTVTGKEVGRKMPTKDELAPLGIVQV